MDEGGRLAEELEAAIPADFYSLLQLDAGMEVARHVIRPTLHPRLLSHRAWRILLSTSFNAL
jgi:hypothetical protein